MVGKGRVVAAAVVRVEDQGHVQGRASRSVNFLVLPQHPQRSSPPWRALASARG